ncbi:olfactory receptor class A related 2 [Danio rerio]|uniref:Vomeronasal type-1 receptor n=1 Tax=Danio rerio TaxID=7955 RepID=A5H1X0_DANRE|nr:olfactory receptor class A related 2 [Danio rerio]ABL01523.1 V1R pheromone receptor-like protein [Danio rerio]|eukprot:NP_001091865.1 olfactory receptor class A related 2 [Danio rerio]
MIAEAVIRGLLFLSLVLVGVPGNTAVICGFILLVRREGRLSPADAIVLHLCSANLVVVSVRCLLEVLATFRIHNVFDDAGCRAVIFLHRTARSLSIWLTFLLTALQCLSVAPPGSRRAAARALLARSLPAIFLALWLINTSMSVASLLYSIGARNDSRLLQNAINVEFCFLSFPSRLARDANGAAQVARDVVPMVLMAAGSLVLLVYLVRQRRRVQGLRGTAGGAAERRAAVTVVTLVSLYLLVFGLDNGLWVYTLTVSHTLSSALITDLRLFFTSLYTAVSPLLILVSNTRLRCGKQPETMH